MHLVELHCHQSDKWGLTIKDKLFTKKLFGLLCKSSLKSSLSLTFYVNLSSVGTPFIHSHLYFSVTQTNGAIVDSGKSTPSPLTCSQKMIHQAPDDPSAQASASSAIRLSPNPSSTHTSILTFLQLYSVTGTSWSQAPGNHFTGGAR